MNNNTTIVYTEFRDYKRYRLIQYYAYIRTLYRMTHKVFRYSALNHVYIQPHVKTCNIQLTHTVSDV